jgi:hypothetical protein
MIPDLVVVRPADANETAGAYKIAIERSRLESRPTVLAFTRQNVANLKNSSIENTCRGAYAVVECDNPELVLIGTGSEVGLCIDASKCLTQTRVRVVSMPSWEIFRGQPSSYRDALLPRHVPKLSVEAAHTMGWGEWADAFVGINCFGASGPGGTCMDKFGFSVPNVVSCAMRCLSGERGTLSDGTQARLTPIEKSVSLPDKKMQQGNVHPDGYPAKKSPAYADVTTGASLPETLAKKCCVRFMTPTLEELPVMSGPPTMGSLPPLSEDAEQSDSSSDVSNDAEDDRERSCAAPAKETADIVTPYSSDLFTAA